MIRHTATKKTQFLCQNFQIKFCRQIYLIISSVWFIIKKTCAKIFIILLKNVYFRKLNKNIFLKR